MALMLLQMMTLALLLVVSQLVSAWSLRHVGLPVHNAIEDVEESVESDEDASIVERRPVLI